MKLVMEVLKARAKVVEGLVSDTRVVVATMDVFCQHRVGLVRGVARGRPRGAQHESCAVRRIGGARHGSGARRPGWDKSFVALMFFGGENQRLEGFNLNPAITGVPWVSADRRDGAPGGGDPHEPMMSEIEEQDGDPVGPIRTIPNARRRPLQEWLANVPTAKLTHC